MVILTDAKIEQPYKMWLSFSDGTSGTIDLHELARKGVFIALQDVTFQRKLYVDRELGTVAWPGGLDLDPVVLYSRVSGRPIEESLHRYYA